MATISPLEGRVFDDPSFNTAYFTPRPVVKIWGAALAGCVVVPCNAPAVITAAADVVAAEKNARRDDDADCVFGDMFIVIVEYV